MSEGEKEAIYHEAGFDNQVGYGNTPALIVVDLQKAFTNTEHPLGGELTNVVEHTNTLLESAHENEVPVVFTRVVTKHPDGADLGVWGKKVPTLKTLKAESQWIELDDRLIENEADYRIEKKQASAFHDTELNSMLTYWGVDTLVITGCTTSGCIRATVIDACSHSYYTIVPERAVGDRADDPHQANLFDMNAKYADVRPTSEVRSYLEEPNHASMSD